MVSVNQLYYGCLRVGQPAGRDVAPSGFFNTSRNRAARSVESGPVMDWCTAGVRSLTGATFCVEFHSAPHLRRRRVTDVTPIVACIRRNAELQERPLQGSHASG